MRYIFIMILGLIGLLSLSACAPISQSDNPQAVHSKRQSAAELNVRLGMNYMERRNIPMAKISFMKALHHDPRSPAAWYSMAYFYEATGDKQKAEHYYLHAISLAPRAGIPHNNYGTFLCRQGRYRESIKQFILATKSPGYIDTSGAYENAGLCAVLLPNRLMAINFFEKSLQSDPNHPTALLELTKLYYQQGDWADAKERLARYHQITKATPESQHLAQLLS